MAAIDANDDHGHDIAVNDDRGQLPFVERLPLAPLLRLLISKMVAPGKSGI